MAGAMPIAEQWQVDQGCHLEIHPTSNRKPVQRAPDIKDQDQDFEFQDQDSIVSPKTKLQLHYCLVEKIITHVIEWCAATKMMIYWSR